MLTIDASVLVAAAIPDEPAHEDALELIRIAGCDGLEIHQPSLALIEVVAAIARRTGDAELARTAGRHLLALPGLVMHPMDADAALSAAEIAAELRLRAADAVYVSTALAQGTTLVTLDAEMASRSAASIPAALPAEWLAGRRL